MRAACGQPNSPAGRGEGPEKNAPTGAHYAEQVATVSRLSTSVLLTCAAIGVATGALSAGAGAISGPGALTKRGGGSLVVGNSGTNGFTGAISIEAGKIQVVGGNDRLPVNASVTLSDVATAELDLNNLNQSLLSLNGGNVGR